MNKLKWLRILNIFVIIGFVVTAIAILIFLCAPIPSLKGSEQMVEIHETAGKILLVLIVLHIILNWNWISTQYLKKKKPAAKPVTPKTK
jgi:hypothetical protein